MEIDTRARGDERVCEAVVHEDLASAGGEWGEIEIVCIGHTWVCGVGLLDDGVVEVGKIPGGVVEQEILDPAVA